MGEKRQETPGTERVHPLTQRWYAHPNDLIGGWSVSNVDKRASALNPKAGEYEVADFISEKAARHIVALHNAWLDRQPSQRVASAIRPPASDDPRRESDG